jgi:hypothetical protein
MIELEQPGAVQRRHLDRFHGREAHLDEIRQLVAAIKRGRASFLVPQTDQLNHGFSRTNSVDAMPTACHSKTLNASIDRAQPQAVAALRRPSCAAGSVRSSEKALGDSNAVNHWQMR